MSAALTIAATVSAGCILLVGEEPTLRGSSARDASTPEASSVADEVLATGQDTPFQVASDGTAVYWTNDTAAGAVMKCTVPCNDGPTAIARDQANPESLVLAADQVVWATMGNGGVWSCAKSNTSCAPKALPPQPVGEPSSIAIAGNQLYITARQAGAVMSCTVGVDSPACFYAWPTLEPDNTEIAVDSVAVSGGRMYWITDHSSIRTCSVSANCNFLSSRTTLLASLAQASALVADDVALYFIEAGGKIRTCALPACTTPSVLASDETGAKRLAVDATHVYWTNPVAGTVRRVSKAGGDVFTITKGQRAPTGIAVDHAHVYFSNVGDGTIHRISKGALEP